MSSRISLNSLSGNLVRISGPGYRENIRLREADELARNADLAIPNFPAGISGASIAMSRLSDLGFSTSRLVLPVGEQP